VLLAAANQLGEGGEEALDADARHVNELARHERLAGLGHDRGCEHHHLGGGRRGWRGARGSRRSGAAKAKRLFEPGTQRTPGAATRVACWRTRAARLLRACGPGGTRRRGDDARDDGARRVVVVVDSLRSSLPLTWQEVNNENARAGARGRVVQRVVQR
jgi:hypothetical protein